MANPTLNEKRFEKIEKEDEAGLGGTGRAGALGGHGWPARRLVSRT